MKKHFIVLFCFVIIGQTCYEINALNREDLLKSEHRFQQTIEDDLAKLHRKEIDIQREIAQLRRSSTKGNNNLRQKLLMRNQRMLSQLKRTRARLQLKLKENTELTNRGT